MNPFYLADKDGSRTLKKEECRRLLLDSLNANVSEDVFETLFRVKKIGIFHIDYFLSEVNQSGTEVLTSDEFIKFFHTLNRREDLYKIMQK
jgi:Ca2+-binding EF-hand superfamily protein